MTSQNQINVYVEKDRRKWAVVAVTPKCPNGYRWMNCKTKRRAEEVAAELYDALTETKESNTVNA